MKSKILKEKPIFSSPQKKRFVVYVISYIIGLFVILPLYAMHLRMERIDHAAHIYANAISRISVTDGSEISVNSEMLKIIEDAIYGKQFFIITDTNDEILLLSDPGLNWQGELQSEVTDDYGFLTLADGSIARVNNTFGSLKLEHVDFPYSANFTESFPQVDRVKIYSLVVLPKWMYLYYLIRIYFPYLWIGVFVLLMIFLPRRSAREELNAFTPSLKYVISRADHIDHEKLDLRFSHKTAPEDIQALIDSLNDMLDRIENKVSIEEVELKETPAPDDDVEIDMK